jgi:hypothetical protein
MLIASFLTLFCGYQLFVRPSGFKLAWDFFSPFSFWPGEINWKLKLKAGPSSKGSYGDGPTGLGKFKIKAKVGKALLEFESSELTPCFLKQLGKEWLEKFKLLYSQALPRLSEREEG